MKFRKGQGAFEYVLILAGVLLIVVLAIVILRGGLGGNAQELSLAACQNQIAKYSGCYNVLGEWQDVDISAAIAADPSLYKCLEYNGAYTGTDVSMCGPTPNPQ